MEFDTKHHWSRLSFGLMPMRPYDDPSFGDEKAIGMPNLRPRKSVKFKIGGTPKRLRCRFLSESVSTREAEKQIVGPTL